MMILQNSSSRTFGSKNELPCRVNARLGAHTHHSSSVTLNCSGERKDIRYKGGAKKPKQFKGSSQTRSNRQLKVVSALPNHFHSG